MPRTHSTLWLPAALALVLVACGEDPQPARPVPESTDQTTLTGAQAPTRPAPATKTPFEKAILAMSRGNSAHFESALALPDGRMQYANGVTRDKRYVFSVRSLPQADASLDGNWYVINGKYMKEGVSGYDITTSMPESMSIMLAALDALPRAEASLSSEPAPMDQAAGINCQPRSVSMPSEPRLLGTYQALGVCIDVDNARMIKLSATTQTGVQLNVQFSNHNEPVQLPDLKAQDWTQEYPLR